MPHLKRRKEPPAPTRCLTEEEWKRLRAELPEHLRDMADFALATGLRWSNVAIQWHTAGRAAADRRVADAVDGPAVRASGAQLAGTIRQQR